MLPSHSPVNPNAFSIYFTNWLLSATASSITTWPSLLLRSFPSLVPKNQSANRIKNNHTLDTNHNLHTPQWYRPSCPPICPPNHLPQLHSQYQPTIPAHPHTPHYTTRVLHQTLPSKNTSIRSLHIPMHHSSIKHIKQGCKTSWSEVYKHIRLAAAGRISHRCPPYQLSSRQSRSERGVL